MTKISCRSRYALLFRCRSRHFTSKSLQAKLVDIIPFFIRSNSSSGCLYARWTRSLAILQKKVVTCNNGIPLKPVSLRISHIPSKSLVRFHRKLHTAILYIIVWTVPPPPFPSVLKKVAMTSIIGCSRDKNNSKATLKEEESARMIDQLKLKLGLSVPTNYVLDCSCGNWYLDKPRTQDGQNYGETSQDLILTQKDNNDLRFSQICGHLSPVLLYFAI